jgi:hypothetical protein
MNVKQMVIMARLRLLQVVLTVLAMLGLAAQFASAQTDITAVLTSVSTYVTAAIGIGITILLFVIGRAVVRKLAK